MQQHLLLLSCSPIAAGQVLTEEVLSVMAIYRQPFGMPTLALGVTMRPSCASSAYESEPFARVLAITYTVFGLTAFLAFAIKNADSLTLPFGILAPLVNLDFTLTLPRSSGVLYNTFLFVAAVLSYALSGWITGVAGALCFNAVAKQTGGIDAKYLHTLNQESAIKSA